MGTAIDILILETDPGDTLALVTELHRHDLAIGRVEIKRATEAAPEISPPLPHIIIASFSQPDRPLFEILESLHESHHSLPVIVVTTRCEPGELVELLECGTAAHLRRQHLGELASLIRFAIDNPLPPPPQPELEIVQEPDSSDARSRMTRSLCGTPAVRRICERCSRIADTSGEWEEFKIFLRRNEKATVTLGICPDCARTLREEFAPPMPARP